MKKSLKNLIQEQVATLTSKSLSIKDYSFFESNAKNIGLDLKIDRSNVSRILNELYKENILIKKNGRPTIFIDRNTLLDYFPFISLPNEFEDNISLENLLSNYFFENKLTKTDKYSSPNIRKVISFIEPILHYPEFEKKVIILVSKDGQDTDKFVESLILKKEKLELSNVYSYMSNSEEWSEFNLFLNDVLKNQTNSLKLIHIKLYQPKLTILNYYVSKIISVFKNKKEKSPIICISLFNNEIPKQELKLISPLTVEIQEFRKEALLDSILNILYFIKTQGIINQTKVSVSKEFLKNLILDSTFTNLDQITDFINSIFYQEIVLLSERPEKIIELSGGDFKFTPENRLPDNQIAWKKIPQSILLDPKDPRKIEDLLRTTEKPPEKKSSLLDSISTQIHPVYQNKLLNNSLIQDLQKTELLKDNSFIFYLKNLVDKINSGISIKTAASFSSESQSPRINEITKKISVYLNADYRTKENYQFFNKLTASMIKSISDVSIPVLIISQSYLRNSIFCYYGNKLSSKRIFYTINKNNEIYSPKTSDAQVFSKIKDVVKYFDRGNGSIILNGFKKDKAISRDLILKLNGLTLTMDEVSFANLLAVKESTIGSNKNIVTLSPRLIENGRKQNNVISKNVKPELTSLKEYSRNNFEDLFQNTDTTVLIPELFTIYNKLIHKLEKTLTTSELINFLFTAVAIIDIKVSAPNTYNNLVNKDDGLNDNTSKILKNEFKTSSLISAMEWNNADLNCLGEIFQNN